MMIEHKHGAFTVRKNPALVARVVEIKEQFFNMKPQIRKIDNGSNVH